MNLTICIQKNLYFQINSNISINFPRKYIKLHYYKDYKDNFCFIQDDICNKEYSKLISGTKECIQNCSFDSIFKYEYKNQCYKSCPNNTISNNKNEFLCDNICNSENPFEIIEEQICISRCNIFDIAQKKCILKYGLDKENYMLKYIQKELSNNNFNCKILRNASFIIKGNNTEFIISSTSYENITNFIDLNEYRSILMKKLSFDESEPLYLFIIKIYNKELSKNKTVFEVYYSINESNLLKLDLTFISNITYNEIINCSDYSIESILFDSCIKCHEGFYPIFDNKNDTFLKANNFIKCYKDPEKYYLDEDNKIYKKCYKSCFSCSKQGNETNHNCLECLLDFKYYEIIGITKNCYEAPISYKYNETETITFYKYLNDNIITENILEKNESRERCIDNEKEKYEFQNKCYEECPSYTEIDKFNPYKCNIKCPEEMPYEEVETQKCIKDCDIYSMFINKCKKNNKNLTQNLNIEIIQEIMNGDLKDLISKVLTLNEENNFIIKDNYDVHLLSTVGNQLNKNEYSSIDFGECEKYLRNISGISSEEEIILYKIEHNIEGFNIPIIEYLLFTQDGKIQLNLSLCEEMNILLYIPVDIDENDVDKYDIKSDFYNNDCNQYSAENGVDLTLYDRKNDYNKNNISLCEKGCRYIKYNSTNKNVECDCNIKNNLNFSRADINSKYLLNQIENIDKKTTNLGVTKCFRGTTEQVKSNSGFYLLLLILIIFIIVFILFCLKGKNMFENKIEEVIHKKFKGNKKIKTKDLNIKDINSNNQNMIFKKYTKIKIKKKKKVRKSKNLNLINKVNSNIEFIKSKSDSKLKKINVTKENEITMEKSEQKAYIDDIPDQENDYELNILSYKLAIIFDKRTCCDYYCSLLKNKQLFMFTFCSFNDYNSGIIKKFIFFLSFAVHYTINTLFFTDDTMHQIYEDEGSYNFNYQLPKILLSAISSTVFLRIILETLVLTDRNILQVKREKTFQNAIFKKKEILKYINLKFAIFFILNFILLILFWHYLTCFNAIYENTQIYLLENVFISFGISLFYPIFWNIFPSALRIYSLNNKKHDNEYIYSISKYLQII